MSSDGDRPRSFHPGVSVAMTWAVGLSSLAYLLSMFWVGRSDGALWVDAPLLFLFASWCCLMVVGRSRLAAHFVGWAGLVSVFAIAAISGGTWSPVLILALVLLSYVECYLDRASTMQLVVACIAGLATMGTLEGMDLLPAQQYTHSSIERALITGVSVLLTAVLLVGRWDARSRTLTRLQRSTESLRAVNTVLDSTRTEAMARARQQQMLARLTVDAFSLAPTVSGLDSAELRHLLSRCCAVAFAELGDGWVCLRRDGDDALPIAEYGQPLGNSEIRFARHWPVHVLGKPWGRLSVEARGAAGQSVALSPNDRLFVDGIVSLITASLGRVETARALREKETLLQEAQRFETVAYKASGVVHDLNNALACILQNAELAREQVELGGQVGEELDGIVEAVLGATSISRQLLGSAQVADAEPSSGVHLATIVREELRLHRASLGKHIRLDCDLADFDVQVPLSPGAARQVLMNLVVNARQAMPSGGCLQIELGPVPAANGTTEVELRVSDTGTGIPSALLDKIFNPMFTTKRDAGGTGLGLATVHSIVQEVGGRIEVRSVVDEGTTFILHFPLVGTAPVVRKATVPVPIGEPTCDRSAGPILLVWNDRPRLRTVTLRMLARFGYRVLEAQSAADVLVLVERYVGAVDLLIMDVEEATADMCEVVRAARGMDPRLSVVMVADPSDPHTGTLEDARMLVKPVTPSQLVANVEGLLKVRLERQDGTDWLQTG